MHGQRDLLAAIFADQPVAGFDSRGLAIYRRNLRANAARALSISFPTVTRLLGRDRLARLAGEFLMARGKWVFDWGLWGEEFPQWLARQRISLQHPYVIDSARLDWLMHCARRAADAQPDYESFSALAEKASLDFSLVTAPGYSVLESAFPIVAIYNAHQGQGDPAALDLSPAAAMLQAEKGQTALVWRRGALACLREVRDEELIWLRLLDGSATTAEEVLSDLPASGMPLEQWLDRAIREQLVIGLSHQSIT